MMPSCRKRWITGATLLLTGALAHPSQAAVGSAVRFDGTNDYIQVTGTSALKPTAQVAVEAWVQVSTSAAESGTVISMGNSYMMRVIKSDGSVQLYIYVGSSTYQSVLSSGVNVKDGRWHHLVAQKTSAALEVYVDGIKRGSRSTTSTINYSLGTKLYLGKDGYGSSSFDLNGLIDEARVYNRALSAAEITAHYNAGAGQYGAPESGLVAGWHLDEGTGTTASDYSGNNHTGTLVNGPTWVSSPVANPSGDTSPPTVSLTSPANGATVKGTISVSATASDDQGVVGVQFKLDGANLGSEDTTSPYSVSWDTTTATNASHTLSAVARDASGKSTTSSSVSVTVNNAPADTTPPTGSIIINDNAAGTNNPNVTLALSATDDSGTVSQMCLWNDGATPSCEPYAPSKSWTLSSSDGIKKVWAKFADRTPNWSAPISDEITLDTTPPSIGFISPKEGDVLTAPAGSGQ